MAKNKKDNLWIWIVGIILIILITILIMKTSVESFSFNDISNIQKVGFGGMGAGKNSINFLLPSQSFTSMSSIDYYFGKYHSASIWTGNNPLSVSSQTSFNLDEYSFGDKYNPDDYAETINEPFSQSRSEIPIAIFNINGKIYEGGIVNFRWRRVSDNEIIYDGVVQIPNPSDQGFEWWDWYSTWSWIGYFPHEINSPGKFRVEITSPWDSKVFEFETIKKASEIEDVCCELALSDNIYNWTKENECESYKIVDKLYCQIPDEECLFKINDFCVKEGIVIITGIITLMVILFFFGGIYMVKRKRIDKYLKKKWKK